MATIFFQPQITETNLLDSNYLSSGSATSGQLLTADGSGSVSWADAPKSAFIINATSEDGETWTVDKTYAELNTAVSTYGANMFVNLNMASGAYLALLPLVSKASSEFTFASISVDTSSATPTFVYTAKAVINSSDTWTISQNLV